MALGPSLEMMGVQVYRADQATDLAPAVEAALEMVFNADQAAAVLIGQGLIGSKKRTRIHRAGCTGLGQ